MLNLVPGTTKKRLRLLCLGAHSDDVEIGCGGTVLRWLKEYESLEITWVVFCASGARGLEARASAKALLRSAQVNLELADFEDAHLPSEFAKAKAFMFGLHKRLEPDVILTHRLEDRHQDHRFISELTWQTWRDHLILEYEIPKFEGDLGHPNLYVPLDARTAQRKVRHLLGHFGSQRSKSWFSAETFMGLMHIRGIECRAPSGLAEAFYMRKGIL